MKTPCRPGAWRLLAATGLTLGLLPLASLAAGSSRYPPASEHPTVDGQFTTAKEYSGAAKEADDLGVGYFYKQFVMNWRAGTVTYDKTTSFFNNHYFSNAAYGQLDLYDLNSFEVKYGSHRIKTWVFLPGDELNDAGWLDIVGIGASNYANGLNDDGGFLVRLDGDPTTDRLWRPGDARPGDPQWSFANTYGVFAAGDFNDSARRMGYDPLSNGSREVYEWSFTVNQAGGGVGGIFGVGGGGGPDNPDPPVGVCDPIWDLVITWREVSDWKPEMGGYGNYGGIGYVPTGADWVLMGFDQSMHPVPGIPEPSTYAMLGLGLAALALRQRQLSATAS